MADPRPVALVAIPGAPDDDVGPSVRVDVRDRAAHRVLVRVDRVHRPRRERIRRRAQEDDLPALLIEAERVVPAVPVDVAEDEVVAVGCIREQAPVPSRGEMESPSPAQSRIDIAEIRSTTT